MQLIKPAPILEYIPHDAKTFTFNKQDAIFEFSVHQACYEIFIGKSFTNFKLSYNNTKEAAAITRFIELDIPFAKNINSYIQKFIILP